jgi:hypothetical protein
VILGVAAFCVVAVGLTASARFVYHHPQGAVLAVSRDGVVTLPSAVDAAAKAPTAGPAGGTPRAEVAETEHDFGTMNPLTMGRHTFRIRNTGDGPLQLRKGPTSCKCTLSRLRADALAPGEEAEVQLEWNTGRDPLYAHEAIIYTNDANNSSIRLVVRGLVRMRIAAVPAEAVMPAVEPGQSGRAELVVYSQVWDAFDAHQASSSLEGIRWRLEPADEATRRAHDATAACRLIVETPPDLPRGRFDHVLQLRIHPKGADPADEPGEDEALDVVVRGEVQGRLAVFGKQIDDRGQVEFGAVSSADGGECRLLLKVRDEERDLRISRVKATPDFLQARLEPFQDKAELGLMQLVLSVPQGARVCSYLGAMAGQLRLEFDHPRIASLDLSVRLAVVP